MNELEERSIQCPYCGEVIRILLDSSGGGQSYVEDCQVCCRPIEFEMFMNTDGSISLSVRREDE